MRAMPRQARIVFAGFPHHVTQRGNHRQLVFFGAEDARAYLRLLREYATEHGVEIVAWCLMPNHVHLVAIPAEATGLHRLLKAVHGQYAQRINRMRELTGHLWQGRYFSSTLDPRYFRNAVRYVELNPVRAGLVERAEAYEWSSAQAHCGRRSDPFVAGPLRIAPFADIEDWSAWLARGLDRESLAALRDNTLGNLPCGSPDFIHGLEETSGLRLTRRKPGPDPDTRALVAKERRPLKANGRPSDVVEGAHRVR